MATTSKKQTKLDAARQFAAKLLDDQDYQDNLRLRLRAGILAPALEVMLYHYVYGKPVEPVEIATRGSDLWSLTDEELAKELAEAAKALTASRRAERANDDGHSRMEEPVH